MKRFALFSFSILCLSIAALIAFHIGSQAAQAQAPEPISGYQTTSYQNSVNHYIMASNGDLYCRRVLENGTSWNGSLRYIGNFWDQPLPTSTSTMGGVKGQYKND